MFTFIYLYTTSLQYTFTVYIIYSHKVSTTANHTKYIITLHKAHVTVHKIHITVHKLHVQNMILPWHSRKVTVVIVTQIVSLVFGFTQGPTMTSPFICCCKLSIGPPGTGNHIPLVVFLVHFIGFKGCACTASCKVQHCIPQ